MNVKSSSKPRTENDGGSPASSSRNKHSSRRLLLGLGITLVIGVWIFREPLRRQIRDRATISNDSPTPDVVADMIEQATDPRAALLAAWNSGKIVHREVAIRSLSRIIPKEQPLPAELNALLLSAALDPDMNVRESALSILQQREHPELAALVGEQLRDVDQRVRLLGLDQVKFLDRSVCVPMVIPLLDDADPLVVTMSLKRLENWTGENFGVKISETASFENEKTGLKEFPEGSHEKARAGAARAKDWWAKHQNEFPPVRLEVPSEAYAARRPVSAGDFQLRTLEGKLGRLSDFRGKVVLINFWTTWCTACVSEMPELIALQRKHGDSLVILGVSLDYVPDSHGHIGGHAAVEEQRNSDGAHDDHEATRAALKRVREKVARTVKARGLNYTILLDEKKRSRRAFQRGRTAHHRHRGRTRQCASTFCRRPQPACVRGDDRRSRRAVSQRSGGHRPFDLAPGAFGCMLVPTAASPAEGFKPDKTSPSMASDSLKNF